MCSSLHQQSSQTCRVKKSKPKGVKFKTQVNWKQNWTGKDFNAWLETERKKPRNKNPESEINFQISAKDLKYQNFEKPF